MLHAALDRVAGVDEKTVTLLLPMLDTLGILEGESRIAALEAIRQSLSLLADDADQDAKVRWDVAARRAAVQVSEHREPLRRRILDLLGRGPSTPSSLSSELGAPLASISRMLRALAVDELVGRAPDPRDGRKRVYALTPLGEAQRTEHRAFGAPPSTPPPLEDNAVVQHLEEALALAVDLRRRQNQLDEVRERLESIVEQAQEIGAAQLALTARGELITTLRQSGRHQELRPHLETLQKIASGSHAAPGDLVLPALGHLEYELGRLPALDADADPMDRVEHLVTAHRVFSRLGRQRDDSALLLRSAWAEVSLADLWRELTEPRAALHRATEALTTFERLDSPYGAARARFMIGFCLRLRGQFDDAWASLVKAHELAADHGYERFTADALMQMGEVRRCQGDLDAAVELLSEASRRAELLEMTVTHGFAESALGATTWQRGDSPQALRHLETAHGLFSERDHQEGLALTLRRHAIVLHRDGTGDSDAAERLRDAHDAYLRMESPAGVVACVIERALCSLRRSRQSLSVQMKVLTEWLHDGTRQRRLIEQDPWVPELLADFAKKTGDAELEQIASAVVSNAESRLAENESETSTLALDRPPAEPSEESRRRRASRRRTPDPMAGEPFRLHRQRPPALA